MKHRLGIAVALLGDSPILMFDEPVNGLDTEGIAWIGQFLKALAADCHGGHADRFRIAACLPSSPRVTGISAESVRRSLRRARS